MGLRQIFDLINGIFKENYNHEFDTKSHRNSKTSGVRWREEDRMVRWQDLNMLDWMGGWFDFDGHDGFGRLRASN